MFDISQQKGISLQQINYHKAVTPAEFVTPDFVLTYVALRMRSLDKEITAQFQQDQQNDADQRALLEAGNALSVLKTSGGKNDEIASALRVAAEKVGDPKIKEHLETVAKSFDNQGNVDAKAIDDVSKKLEEFRGTLSNGRELRQMQLQSVVAQRQTALQMGSNLLSNFSETVKAMVNNIK